MVINRSERKRSPRQTVVRIRLGLLGVDGFIRPMSIQLRQLGAQIKVLPLQIPETASSSIRQTSAADQIRQVPADDGAAEQDAKGEGGETVRRVRLGHRRVSEAALHSESRLCDQQCPPCGRSLHSDASRSTNRDCRRRRCRRRRTCQQRKLRSIHDILYGVSTFIEGV